MVQFYMSPLPIITVAALLPSSPASAEMYPAVTKPETKRKKAKAAKTNR